VVGDGNFAVVRVCYSRQTRREFAVKIIDKVTQGADWGNRHFCARSFDLKGRSCQLAGKSLSEDAAAAERKHFLM
jgi:hypothetical protein